MLLTYEHLNQKLRDYDGEVVTYVRKKDGPQIPVTLRLAFRVALVSDYEIEKESLSDKARRFEDGETARDIYRMGVDSPPIELKPEQVARIETVCGLYWGKELGVVVKDFFKNPDAYLEQYKDLKD